MRELPNENVDENLLETIINIIDLKLPKRIKSKKRQKKAFV